MLEKQWKKILRRRKLSLLTIPAFILWLISILYRLLVILKKSFSGTSVQVDIPIISVGNITVGGSGKTPLVSLLARFLLNEGYRVGVVSSGYGRESEESFLEPGYKIQKMKAVNSGDEVKYLSFQLPEAIFSVDSDKATAAVKLAQSNEVDLIIVDDGFQHFKLKRDIDIITYDAGIEKKYLKLFPYGVLRESLSALKRADIIIITRANFARDLYKLQQKLQKINPNSEHYHARFSSSELVAADRELPDKYLEDKSVFLFAGIGNFNALRKQVQALSADLDFALELDDHQVYSKELLGQIKDMADKYDSDLILTTGKDWVKIEEFDFCREFYYLNQILDLDPGEEKLIKYLEMKLNLKKQKQ